MEPGSLSIEFVLLGTFLPVLGTMVTILMAGVTKGWVRWAVLVLMPLVVLGVCVWMGPAVLFNGNLLAAVVLSFYCWGLMYYYPALLALAVIAALRHERRQRQSAA